MLKRGERCGLYRKNLRHQCHPDAVGAFPENAVLHSREI